MKHLVIFLLSVCFAFSLVAQRPLFMPLEFQKAIEKGTRTKNGLPGKNYWINHADYNIKAYFDPQTANLKGSAQITYYNNSPDTLKIIVIRLYQDWLKKGSMRDFVLDPNDIHNGTQVSNLKIDGQVYTKEKIRLYSGIMTIKLEKSILPRSKANIEIDWEVKIPTNRAVRYGKYGERTFFIGYWYPEIAVYDDIMGWDTRPFTGSQEYYNDHNNFYVELTVPVPNVVWSSGELINMEQVFDEKIIKRIKQAQNSENIEKIITQEDIKRQQILKKTKGELTWIFEAKQIPQFAFATSDHYVWDASSLKMPNNNRVFISAVYNPENKEFSRKAWLSREIIKHYSFKLLKIPFPYPQMTVFNGGGAMEYPGMVNEANFPDSCADVYVTAHEIGHTYFPFYTGSNETFYAWMDEGIINFIPRFIAQDIFPEKCQDIFKSMIEKYARTAGSIEDLPIMVSSAYVYIYSTYRNIAYNRPAFALYQLEQYVGKEKFFEALREFTKRWAYKHSYPYDFFNTFNQILGENLTWFWRSYFFEFAYPDLSIDSYNYVEGKLSITIKNTGGLPVALKLYITDQNNNKMLVQRKMSVWKNTDRLTLTLPLSGKPRIIEIDNLEGADKNPQDNIIKLW